MKFSDSFLSVALSGPFVKDGLINSAQHVVKQRGKDQANHCYAGGGRSTNDPSDTDYDATRKDARQASKTADSRRLEGVDVSRHWRLHC